MKAVCDFADEAEEGSFQQYAAYTSASVLAGFAEDWFRSDRPALNSDRSHTAGAAPRRARHPLRPLPLGIGADEDRALAKAEW